MGALKEYAGVITAVTPHWARIEKLDGRIEKLDGRIDRSTGGSTSSTASSTPI